MNVTEALNILYEGPVVVVNFSKSASSSYRYKCSFPVKVGDYVVVPHMEGQKPCIGLVEGISDESILDITLNYKHVIGVVDFTEYNRVVDSENALVKELHGCARASIRAALLAKLKSGEPLILE